VIERASHSQKKIIIPIMGKQRHFIDTKALLCFAKGWCMNEIIIFVIDLMVGFIFNK